VVILFNENIYQQKENNVIGVSSNNENFVLFGNNFLFYKFIYIYIKITKESYG